MPLPIFHVVEYPVENCSGQNDNGKCPDDYTKPKHVASIAKFPCADSSENRVLVPCLSPQRVSKTTEDAKRGVVGEIPARRFLSNY